MGVIKRYESNAWRSRVVVHNDTVYLAGQVADDWSGDITQQTRETLANIDRMLALAGSDKSKLLSATIWIKRLSDYDAMNAVWDAWLAPGAAPGRACAVLDMADPDILVEITPIAAL